MRFSKVFSAWARSFLFPVPLLGLKGLFRYYRDWRRFNKCYPRQLSLADSYPCLTDWTSSTPFDAHYFFQAAWLARELAEYRPSKHVDVGSDVRMIGVLSAYVATEFVDFRPLPVDLHNLSCVTGNLTKLARPDNSIWSLSCLHVVEHVGLGRYGDPIDPEGSFKALAELGRVLAVGGSLYLSVPVGRERVCFNAHRVFSPETIVSALPDLTLREFSLVDDAGCFLQRAPLSAADGLEYGCGMFHFIK